ncbi:MAG: crotonase/enoyl-CoA hydratase family protein [Paracoccaceae bacterium]
MYETLLLETDSRGIAVLTLNQPARHNVINPTLCGELEEAASRIDADQSIRAVVLTGSGKSFCAGGDLGWMREQFHADRSARMRQARRIADVLKVLNTLRKPLIGRINGQAYGGGLGLIAVCDDAVAVDTARFGFTETRLGLIPATISPYVAARIGEAMARRVFMSARIFDASEAVALGLVSASVSAEDLDGAVTALVEPYLSAAPGAVAASKALLRRLGPPISDAIIEDTIARLADAWETPEAQAGIAAFFEKRDPPWKKP